MLRVICKVSYGRLKMIVVGMSDSKRVTNDAEVRTTLLKSIEIKVHLREGICEITNMWMLLAAMTSAKAIMSVTVRWLLKKMCIARNVFSFRWGGNKEMCQKNCRKR